MRLEVRERSLHIFDEEGGHIDVEPLPDKYALDDDILRVRGKRVGGNLPAS